MNITVFCKGKTVPEILLSFVLSYTAVLLETAEECVRHFILSVSKDKNEVLAKSFRTGAVQNIRHTIDKIL